MTTEPAAQSSDNTSSASSPPPPTSTAMPGPKFKFDPSRAATLFQNLAGVNARIARTCRRHEIAKTPRLVAVSKLKPITDILALCTPASAETRALFSQEGGKEEEEGDGTAEVGAPEPQLHFGENYVQELIEKSRLLPKSIRWHFIGGLQSNKCTQLAREVENLWAVESVDTEKKARSLDKGREQRNAALLKHGVTGIGGDDGEEDKRLRVFVQVNTSGEDAKSGVPPRSDSLVALCTAILRDCPNLKLQGLMTIGAIARSHAVAAAPETANEDFVSLRETRDWLAEKLGVPCQELELSMGMSDDFEGAIAQGSSEVRVGSTIFGARPPKGEARIVQKKEEEKKG